MKIIEHKYIYIILIYSCLTSALATAQEGEVTIRQDERIERLIEIKKALNKADDGEKRYRIQIYSGTLSGARNTMASFKLNFSGWYCDIKFETPNYKVYIGKYKTRLEADRQLVILKEKYPNAIIPAPL
ncbi:MAG: SPOR domain-containing protein [Bacteroidota bacterium]